MSFRHVIGKGLRRAAKRRLLLEKLDSREVLDGAGAVTPDLASVETAPADSLVLLGSAEYGGGVTSVATANSTDWYWASTTSPIGGDHGALRVKTVIGPNGAVIVTEVEIFENLDPISITIEPANEVTPPFEPGTPITITPTAPEWKPFPTSPVLIDPTLPRHPGKDPSIQPGAPVTIEPAPEWKPSPTSPVLIDPTIPYLPKYPSPPPGTPVTIAPAPEWRAIPIGPVMIDPTIPYLPKYPSPPPGTPVTVAPAPEWIPIRPVLIDPTIPRLPGKDPSIQPGDPITIAPAPEWKVIPINTVIVEDLTAPGVFDWSILFASGAKKKISSR